MPRQVPYRDDGRTPPAIVGFCQRFRVVVGSRTIILQRRSSSRNSSPSSSGESHRSPQTLGWHSRDRGWGHVSAVGRTHNRAANQPCRGEGDSTVPVRTDHKGRRGVRRSRDSDFNRPGPCSYSPFCRRSGRFRFDIKGVNAGRFAGHGRRGTPCSHLSPSSTVLLPPTFGRTMWELCTMSFKERAGSKVTH